MAYSVEYVRGHMEIYNDEGKFLFSADNAREVQELLKEFNFDS